jgi:hypothetical protein
MAGDLYLQKDNFIFSKSLEGALHSVVHKVGNDFLCGLLSLIAVCL